MVFTSAVYAQNDSITIDVEISRTRVYVGDQLTYQIIVRGVGNPSTPVIDFPDSVRAEFRGRSSQSYTTMRIIQGRNRSVTDRHFSYQYILTAVSVGDISIPAPVITVNGQAYEGKSVSFESLFPIESDTDFLEMNIERNSLYLNETVQIECVWWIGANTTEFSFSSSYFPDSFVFRGMELQSGNAKRIGFEINNNKLVGVLLSGQHDGVEMEKLVFRFSITPTQVGDFDLGPLRTVFTRHSGTGGSYRSYIEAEPIVVSVESVPTVNQPDSYDGAIGSFDLESDASNSVVNVGDPIVLMLRIEGDEPMVGIDDAPNLATDPQFTRNFKVSSEGWRETLPRRSGRRLYETTIRALHEHVDEIPSIRLHSFNPVGSTYEVFKSDAIPISVNPVEEITLSDAVVGSNSADPTRSSPSVEHSELTPAMPGLWAHGSVDELLTEPGLLKPSPFGHPLMIGLAASGPVAFAISLVFATARGSRNPRRKALHKAWKQSQSLDRQGKHAQALRVYIAAALRVNTDALTAQDVAQLPLHEDDANTITSCLIADECDGFFGKGQSIAGDYVHRPELLRDVHQQIVNAGEWS